MLIASRILSSDLLVEDGQGVGVGGGGGGSGASSELVALGVILRYAEPS